MAVGGSPDVSGNTTPTTTTIATSLDGITWTSRNNPFATAAGASCAWSVTWNGSIWNVVGENYDSSVFIATSYDGINWVAKSYSAIDNIGYCSAARRLLPNIGYNPPGDRLLGPALTDNFTVAPCNDGIAYSYDGINWNLTLLPNWAGQGNAVIVWNGLLWLGSGYDKLIYSSNGIDWTLLDFIRLIDVFDIKWNGSIWLIGGQPGNGTVSPIQYSYDGINWTSSNISSSNQQSKCYGIAWNGSMWICIGFFDGSTNILARSYDGTFWTIISYSMNLTNPLNYGTIAYGNGKWIIGVESTNTNMDEDKIAYSTDGINWTVCLTQNDLLSGCLALEYNGTIWVAGGFGNNSIVWSDDGITWNAAPSAINYLNKCTSVCWNGTYFIGSNLLSTNMIYSSDGKNWKNLSRELLKFELFANRRVASRFKPETGALILNRQIQRGTATTEIDGTLTITFSPPFNSTPIITLGVLSGPNYIYISSSSNTSFSVYSATISGNTATSANFNWIAIA